MACRKDGKGRVLRKGEHYRKTDGRYSYIYTDPLGKKRTIYAKSLVTLRQKEDELVRDQMDGLNVYVAGSADVNFCLIDIFLPRRSCEALQKQITYIHGIILSGIRSERKRLRM